MIEMSSDTIQMITDSVAERVSMYKTIDDLKSQIKTLRQERDDCLESLRSLVYLTNMDDFFTLIEDAKATIERIEASPR